MQGLLRAVKNPWVSVSAAVVAAYVYPLSTQWRRSSLTRTLSEEVGCIASVDGGSMQPTLNPAVNGKPRHEWVWVSKIGCKRFEYSRGDVVMLRCVRR